MVRRTIFTREPGLSVTVANGLNGPVFMFSDELNVETVAEAVGVSVRALQKCSDTEIGSSCELHGYRAKKSAEVRHAS